MKKLNINNKKVQDRLERLMRLLGQIENLKDFMEGEYSTPVEEVELDKLIVSANNCIEIIEAYTQKDIKTVLKSKTAYTYRNLNLSVLEPVEAPSASPVEVELVEVKLQDLSVVAFESGNQQFVSVEIGGEYFSSFNMIELTAGQVAFDIKSVYGSLSLADIRNVILEACEKMPKKSNAIKSRHAVNAEVNLVLTEETGEQIIIEKDNKLFATECEDINVLYAITSYGLECKFEDVLLSHLPTDIFNEVERVIKVIKKVMSKPSKIEAEIIEDLEAQRCFYKNSKDFNRVVEIAQKRGYSYILVSPCTVLDNSTQRVEFLKDNTIDERRVQGRARLYGPDLARPITIDTLIPEAVIPEAIGDDNKVSEKATEYVIVVVEESNTFYLTEIYSEDFLTMREAFKSSGCKVFKYSDSRFIALVKRGTQYIK